MADPSHAGQISTSCPSGLVAWENCSCWAIGQEVDSANPDDLQQWQNCPSPNRVGKAQADKGRSQGKVWALSWKFCRHLNATHSSLWVGHPAVVNLWRKITLRILTA